MTTPEPPEQPDWLLEPPSAGELHVYVAVGDDIELSPDARAAIEALVTRVQDDEVMGFLPPCGGLAACGRYYCGPLGKCAPLQSSPCKAEMTCKVQEVWGGLL